MKRKAKSNAQPRLTQPPDPPLLLPPVQHGERPLALGRAGRQQADDDDREDAPQDVEGTDGGGGVEVVCNVQDVLGHGGGGGEEGWDV